MTGPTELPPTPVPPDADPETVLRLRFPVVPPLASTEAGREWTALGLRPAAT